MRRKILREQSSKDSDAKERIMVPKKKSKSSFKGEGHIDTEISDIKKRLDDMEMKYEDLKFGIKTIADSMTTLTHKFEDLSVNLEDEAAKRKRGLQKAASQNEEVMKLCRRVADNIDCLNEKESKDEKDVARLKKKVQAVEDRLFAAETQFNPDHSALTTMEGRVADMEIVQEDMQISLRSCLATAQRSRPFTNSAMKSDIFQSPAHRSGSESGVGVGSSSPEHMADKLLSKITALQNQMDSALKPTRSISKLENDVKYLKSQMKYLAQNTSTTCTHLSTGLTEIQASTINLFEWAQSIDNCLEYNRTILGMGKQSNYALPKVRIPNNFSS
jgi:predicted  nucleic acid-binding Zn-ribbon protein